MASAAGLAGVGSGFGGMVFSWLEGELIDAFGYVPVFYRYGDHAVDRLVGHPVPDGAAASPPRLSTAARRSTHGDVHPMTSREMMAILLTVLGGASVTSASGSLGSSTIAAYEQLAIDDEFYQIAKRFAEGVAVSEETMPVDVISRVGVGGCYLTDEHTLGLMCSGEHYMPRLLNRDGPHGQGMLDRAHRAVAAILAEHKPAVSDAVRDAV